MQKRWTLRALDHFFDRNIGSFVCFVFSLFHLFRRTPRDKTIKKILVIELFEMGASYMAYPSLKYIKQNPHAEIYVLCLNNIKEPWLTLDVIEKENVYAIDNSSFRALAWSILKQTRSLSRQNIDLIIDFELFTRISAIISYLIRAKFRAGFYRYKFEGLYRGTFHDVKCAFNQNMHIARNFLALTKSAVQLSTAYYNYDGPIPEEEIVVPTYRSHPEISKISRQKIRALYANYSDQPLILVAPTVGHQLPSRDYPKDQYVDVIKKLLHLHKNHLVLLIGTPAHGPVAEYIQEHVNDVRCINFRHQTSTFTELMELFLLSDLLISNDAGNPHFASMTPLKSLVLFGPETPFMYGPLGNSVCMYEFFHSSPSYMPYTHKNPATNETNALKVIHPDSVVEMAETLLEGKGVYRTINNKIPYLV
jgi:ADP-heptose:LPS heptosyltransferase